MLKSKWLDFILNLTNIMQYIFYVIDHKIENMDLKEPKQIMEIKLTIRKLVARKW